MQASGIPGTSFDLVLLVTYPGEQLLDARSLLGEHNTTLYFDYPTLPASGRVIARYYRDIYQDGEPVDRLLMATSPLVTIPPTSLSVNGAACCQTLPVNPGDDLVVSVNDSSGHATDWVGLFRVGAPNDQLVDKKYLNDSAVEPPPEPREGGSLHFDPVLVQGWDYEFRLFESGGTSPIAVFTFVHVNVIPPTLTINGVGMGGQIDVAMGQALVVQVADRPTSTDGPTFVAALRPEGEACDPPLLPMWPIGAATASIAVSAPVDAGAYRLYVCRLADDSQSWAVQPVPSPQLVVHAPVLTVNDVGAGGMVRSRPNATLTAQVRWAPDLTDLVEIRTTAGRPEAAGGYQGASNQQVATVAFITPNPQFDETLYEARLLRTDGVLRAQGPTINPWSHYPIYLRTSTVPESDSVDLQVTAGDSVQAAVEVGGHVAGDWLGLFRVLESDGNWVQRVMLPETTTATLFDNGVTPVYRVNFVMPAGGPYEVRFISSASVRLGVSRAITVEGGGPSEERTLTLSPPRARPGDLITFTTTGPIFGTGDTIELVRVLDSQVITGPTVTGPNSYAMPAPQVKGSYHTRWVSADGAERVNGPDLRLGLPGVDTRTYYDTDAIGSVRLVTDATGAVVERHDYLPFGTEWPTQGAMGEHSVKFAGKERDAESGLDYFGARLFSAMTGRFSTVDPGGPLAKRIVEPQRWNPYASTP